MKTSYVLEMQHFLCYQIKMNRTELKNVKADLSVQGNIHESGDPKQ